MFSLYKITTYPRKSKREGRPRCRGWCRNCTQTCSACRLRPPPSSLCFRTCILMSKTLSRNSESEARVVCVNCPWELQKKYQEGSFCGRLLVLAWCIYYGRCNRSRRKCTRKFPPLFIIFILNTILKYQWYVGPILSMPPPCASIWLPDTSCQASPFGKEAGPLLTSPATLSKVKPIIRKLRRIEWMNKNRADLRISSDSWLQRNHGQQRSTCRLFFGEL